jgi:uroporphyrin-III C-methyltransferase
MNVETDKVAPAETDTTEKNAGPINSSSKSTVIVLLAIVLAVAAIIFSGFNYQLIRARSTDTSLTDTTTRLDRQITELNRAITTLTSSQADLQTEIARLEQEQSRQADNLQTLFQLQGQDNTAWAVAEIENLLIMAIHRLTLERDVTTSLAALEAAHTRLVNLADPALFSVRRQLTSDINALKSINVVDITGLSLYLADFLARSGELQLKPTAPSSVENDDTPLTTEASAWQRLSSAVWQEFRSMFVVTRTGSNARATLLPDETWFLYQNLRLQLETARLAIIRRDTETFRTSLELVKSWLTEYFDSSDGTVTNLMNTTERMLRLDLDPALPDISSSLETLRAYQRDRNGSEQPGN